MGAGFANLSAPIQMRMTARLMRRNGAHMRSTTVKTRSSRCSANARGVAGADVVGIKASVMSLWVICEAMGKTPGWGPVWGANRGRGGALRHRDGAGPVEEAGGRR